MRPRARMALALALVPPGLLAAWAQPPRPLMKGMELYSWTDTRSAWRFSLLPGTNRLKTLDEITAPPYAIPDLAALKQRLEALPAGEQVQWFHGSHKELRYPDRHVIDDLVAFSAARQIALNPPRP